MNNAPAITAPPAPNAKPNREGRTKFGWKPDVPDHRDHTYKLTRPHMAGPIVKEKVLPLGLSNSIEDQGDLGSCTGHAATAMLEINLQYNTSFYPEYSRLMAYYLGRQIDGTVRTDAGAQIRSVIKGLVKYGVCREQLWPYIESKFRTKPPKLAYTDADALVTAITEAKMQYYRVTSLAELKAALSEGYTVTFGFMVPETIWDITKRRNTLSFPKSNVKVEGGHAVVAVGYEDGRQFVWVRNSWGEDWGDRGMFRMPYSWFTSSQRLVDDMWVIKP